MQHHHPRQRVWYDDPVEDEATANRQTASLGGVVVALLLIVVGLFLVHQLHAKAQIEDCLLEGRTNCSLLLPPATPETGYGGVRAALPRY